MINDINRYHTPTNDNKQQKKKLNKQNHTKIQTKKQII